MTKSAVTGPIIAYGQRLPLGTGTAGNVNPDLAPSLFWGGAGVFDPRLQYNNTRSGALGFSGAGNIPVINQVPSTIADNNIAASQLPVSGTAMTLASASAAGITVTTAAATYWPSQTSVPAAACIIDTAPALLGFGTNHIAYGFPLISLYDTRTMLARNVRVTMNGNDTGGFYTVAGYDIYGYAMSELFTGVNNGIVQGKKAFKFVTSVTPSGTILSTLSKVGTGDVIGFPIRSDYFGDIRVFWNNAIVTANTGYLGADTATATTTTGDVRGTYALQAASNNALRLQVFITPPVANLGTDGTVTGLFGVTQA